MTTSRAVPPGAFYLTSGGKIRRTNSGHLPWYAKAWACEGDAQWRELDPQPGGQSNQV